MNIDDIKIGSPEHALALADSLEGLEEASIGPSDIELCVKALRGHASGCRIRDIGKISADGEITIELLERCLDRLAFAMERAPQGGEVYLPLFERFEADIEAMKAIESTMARARRRSQTFNLSAHPA